MDDASYSRSITDKFILASSKFKQEIKAEWLEALFSNDVISNIRFKVSFSLG